ncbi:MAG: hypothetical protein ACRD2F_02745 [Terriglobales bacterium]
MPAGELLGDGEFVLRGLNPALYPEGGLLEPCFILKKLDDRENGPSFGIEAPGAAAAANAPLGARYGISCADFATVIKGGWGIARLNVGNVLSRQRAAHQPQHAVEFRQKDAPDWGGHRRAHSHITGHQELTNKERAELVRELARQAAAGVVRQPTRP